jgi:hypothetical protein
VSGGDRSGGAEQVDRVEIGIHRGGTEKNRGFNRKGRKGRKEDLSRGADESKFGISGSAGEKQRRLRRRIKKHNAEALPMAPGQTLERNN